MTPIEKEAAPAMHCMDSGLSKFDKEAAPASHSVASNLSLPQTEELRPISKDLEAAKGGPAPAWHPQKQEHLVMVTLAFISLMVALDATILVPVLPTLAKDLHGTSTQAFWAGTSYLLTSAVCQPFIAALSDIFGRRELLIPSILLFTIGSIVCGVAHNFTELLTGRCLQGVGGGGIITLAQVIFADIVPLRQRPKYFSLVLAAWGVGSVMGPLVGGLLVEKVTWRWAFFINLPFCGIGILASALFINLETAKTSLKEKLLRVDWIGGFLFISSLTSFLIGLSWAGVQFSWRSFHTLVPIILGAAGVVASLIWERYGAREPFFRRSLFHEGSAIAAYICALIQGLLLFCLLYYTPFYFAAVQLKSPISSGLGLFPATAFLLPGSAVVSVLITRLGRFRWAIWIGWVIATTGTGLLILLDEHTKLAVWVIALIVFGLGNGMVLSSVNFGIQAIARTEDCGRAASMYAFTRTLGMTIGVAVGGTVFQNFMSLKLGQLGLPTEIAADAEAYVAILKTLAANDPVREGVTLAYVHGFRGVFMVLTGISGIGLIASMFIRHHGMNKILESNYRLSRESAFFK